MPAGDHRFWRYESDQHQAVFAAVQSLSADQSARDQRLRQYLELYGNRPVTWLTTDTPPTIGDVSLQGTPTRPTNLVYRVVSTLISELSQNKPRPWFVTSGGDWDSQRQAEKLTKFVEGIFYECGVPHTAVACGKDSLIWGTGIVRIGSEFGRIKIDRVPAHEIILDERAVRNGCIRTIYHRHWIDRYVLAELYPDFEREILADSNSAGAWEIGRNQEADQIKVIEAWHVPSKPEKNGQSGSNDGKRVVCIANATLDVVDWDDPTPPFVFLHWDPAVFGFWGPGVVERLRDKQYQLDELEQAIDEAHHLMAKFRIFVPNNSGITESMLDNLTGSVVKYNPAAGPPVISTANAVSGDVYNERQYLIASAFEEIGVSQLAAQSQKPAGLNSGVALRTFIDNQSRRFIAWLQAYEEFHVEMARQIVREMRRLAEADRDYEVVYRGENRAEKIRWRDVDLDESAYVLQVFPTSALPQSPAGRLQTLQELMQSGIIDKDSFLRLMNSPDLENEFSSTGASRDLIERTLQQILETGEYVMPEPLYDLRLCILLGGRWYLRAKLQNASEDRLQLIRNWVVDAEALLSAASAPAEMAPAEMSPAEMTPVLSQQNVGQALWMQQITW